MSFCRRIICSAITLMLSAGYGVAFAESVSITDARIGGFEAQGLTISGATIDKAAIEAAFVGPDDTAAFVALSADTITISSLFYQQLDGGNGRFELRDIAIEQWSGGTARRLTVAGLTFHTFTGTEASLQTGAIVAGNLTVGPILAELATVSDVASLMASESSGWSPKFQSISVAKPAFVSASAAYRIEIASVTLLAGDYVGTLPQQMTLKVDGFTTPSIATGPAATLFAAPLSGRIQLSYDAKALAFAITDASVFSSKLGTLAISAAFTNVTPALFQGSEADIVSALIGAAMTSASIAIDDKGLSEAFLTVIGARQSKSPVEVRAEAAELVRLVVPAMLAGSPLTPESLNAVADFVQKPGFIKVSAKPKSGSLGAADFIAIEGPADILSKLDLIVSRSP
jgi:hypothetical protein